MMRRPPLRSLVLESIHSFNVGGWPEETSSVSLESSNRILKVAEEAHGSWVSLTASRQRTTSRQVEEFVKRREPGNLD